jgi:hypothetical protein
MPIKDYFEHTKGIGVLSTADSAGQVDAAIYARPHFMDDGTIAFIMRDRLTHHNLGENLSAVYLFIEDGHGYKGVRLYLKKVKEDTNPELLAQLTRRCLSPEDDAAKGSKFLVYFAVKKTLALIGSDSPQFRMA